MENDMETGVIQGFIGMRVSQNWGYHFGVPITRTVVYWGLYWGPPILGNYHILVLYEDFAGSVLIVL